MRGRGRSIEDQFYAGNYAVIVDRCADVASGHVTFVDLPFVIGALAFAGRLEDARALFSSQLRRRATSEDSRALVMAQFFLGVAYCRAGRMAEAKEAFVASVRARRAGPLARFYVSQGLGCLRYFTGHLRQAARHALSALHHAFDAEFPYGRLLATDLRGHALVQLGQIRSGLSLLETARALACSLGSVGNVAALDCALGIYRARFGVVSVQQALVDLNELLGKVHSEDSYSRRSLRIELSVQTALAGDGDGAWAELERLGHEHVPDGGDTRARIRYLLACATVARLRYGARSMRPFVSEARELLRARGDAALELDVLCMVLLSSKADEVAAAREEILELHRRSGIARVWLRACERRDLGFVVPPGAEVLEEDRLGALYVACLQPSRELATQLIASGHWGLLPLALGLEPGQRLLLFERHLGIESRGNVRVVAAPPKRTLQFLHALAHGRLRSKEELLASVWGIVSYRPDAHDAVIHTAVRRLRTQLDTNGHWIEAASGGYRLAAGVELVSAFAGDVAAEALAIGPDSTLSSASAPSERKTPLPPARSSAEPDAILELLARSGPASSSDIASRLGVSEMTALRRLREQVERGAVCRDGKGKKTRYRLLQAS
ncbi:MAG: hypothetical protein ACOY0T_17055 [Myxococcota bacterium]